MIFCSRFGDYIRGGTIFEGAIYEGISRWVAIYETFCCIRGYRGIIFFEVQKRRSFIRRYYTRVTP